MFDVSPAAVHLRSLGFSKGVDLGKMVDVEGYHSPTRYHRYTQ